MSHPLLHHRLERLLIETIDRLCDEFPNLPLGIVSRCVEAARVTAPPAVPQDLTESVARIEMLAREDLRTIDGALQLQGATA